MSAMCASGACPAAILTEDNTAYIQGYKLKEQEKQQLYAPMGEDFVRIPLPVLKKIAAHVLES